MPSARALCANGPRSIRLEDSRFTIRICGAPMRRGKKPHISARKQPRQARSTQLVADILEAAVRVLVREGAHGFTTARVAEAARVSVGSLYQYFPNKEAILFRLQADEWGQTMSQLRRILGAPAATPLERLRAAILLFFCSVCVVAAFRSALEVVVFLFCVV